MARIRHIALLTQDPPKLAQFYQASFGMKEVARSAILPARGRPEGIFHFGFEVANAKEAMQVALETGATKGTDSLPKDGRFAEAFVRDPVGTRVDLSEHGWKV